jgi:hypothetical protein
MDSQGSTGTYKGSIRAPKHSVSARARFESSKHKQLQPGCWPIKGLMQAGKQLFFSRVAAVRCRLVYTCWQRSKRTCVCLSCCAAFLGKDEL